MHELPPVVPAPFELTIGRDDPRLAKVNKYIESYISKNDVHITGSVFTYGEKYGAVARIRFKIKTPDNNYTSESILICSGDSDVNNITAIVQVIE